MPSVDGTLPVNLLGKPGFELRIGLWNERRQLDTTLIQYRLNTKQTSGNARTRLCQFIPAIIPFTDTDHQSCFNQLMKACDHDVIVISKRIEDVIGRRSGVLVKMDYDRYTIRTFDQGTN